LLHPISFSEESPPEFLIGWFLYVRTHYLRWILLVLGRLLIFDIRVWVSHLEKFMIWLTLLFCRRPSLHIHLQLFN
jgi:hypothetical protein